MWIFVPTGNVFVDIIGDFIFEVLYTQISYNLDVMLESGIDLGIIAQYELDAETLMEILLC